MRNTWGSSTPGAYERPEWWLSDGWNARSVHGWTAPLYWEKTAEGWRVMTLAGPRGLQGDEPVCHINFYEADAFARWAGAACRPRRSEERAAEGAEVAGTFPRERAASTPLAAPSSPTVEGSPSQLFGDVWEWTGSPYVAYPGYRPAAGAARRGYNGKFMACNQMVLRRRVVRPRLARTSGPPYLQFLPPRGPRWQFSGVRLARDA